MVDTTEVAEVIGGILKEQAKQDGAESNRSSWIRFVIIAFVAGGAWYMLRGDVDKNCAKIDAEISRSTEQDKQSIEDRVRLNLNVNTLTVKQDTMLLEQRDIKSDIKEVDDKVDEVLRRLPE